MPKPNMSPTKNPMPMQDPKVRARNFDEVAIGYTAEIAVSEAQRCINCKAAPCMTGCPVNIDIPGFLGRVAEGDFERAYRVITRSSNLPAICGRVCPQESQCESRCTRGIKGEAVAIGRVERFVADYHMANHDDSLDEPEEIKKNGHKVAIVGSGPSGLACAADLAKMGYDVTIFEALHKAGGVLSYGIPEFRLPKAIVQREIESLERMGVTIETNTVIDRSLLINELREEGFEAAFIGSGAGLPKFMDIPGENYKGVYAANEYLVRINLMKAYLPDSPTPIFRGKNVAVVGGGNVAMDAARCALRMGADNVYIVYRRGMEELPARAEEVENALEEGVQFKTLTNPKAILGNDKFYVSGMECVEMELGEPDATGRRTPQEKPDSTFVLDVDQVIMALGTTPNPLITKTTTELQTNNHGCLVVDGKGMTSKRGIYAGGDAVTGAATVIRAMGAGKNVAIAIDDALSRTL